MSTVHIPSHRLSASTTLPSSTYTALTASLISSGGIERIQSVMTDSLAASGFTQNLRKRILSLLRCGECTNYTELMDVLFKEVGAEIMRAQKEKEKEKGMNGHTNGTTGKSEEERPLRIPESAVEDGVVAVRRELNTVCTIDITD
ncbi:hypothetical protein K402DRAFT_194920 [Aulographum hederae CBS 113979]|uniref:Uncharacterized protein n=1 Tax=Aulographum hederae CBS 113979 TaxID=1176131 RepID=A0A6G1GNU1_9PEZI|nr:hypothetical protein K402DRAFT_194920 [Aulographum hederae CBS 113979]